MPVRSICLYPEPVLRVIPKMITKITAHHSTVIKDLLETLRIQPGGIGIAAPQIGYADRIVVVDVRRRDPSKSLKVMVNPEIIEGTDRKMGREGCMSLPDYTGNVTRAQKIKVKWRDEFFREHEMEVSGIEAVCIQHEIDHLNGLLFIDRVVSTTRDVFRRKKYL